MKDQTAGNVEFLTPRLLTGDRPTGKLHLGHYVGKMKDCIILQDKYDSFFLIADYHMLTTRTSHLQQIEGYIRDIVIDYLAVGYDPERATIFLQSLVPQIPQIALILSMLVNVPRAQRVPTLKETMKDLRISQPSLGLLSYPVLQAADILSVRAEVVPVGKDQAAHLEITREIAHRFNDLYGKVFPEPRTLIGEVGILPGIDGRKMSKSLGNAIFLSDDEQTVTQKVMGMYANPPRIHSTDPGRVENDPVFIYHDAFNPNREEVDELKARYRTGKVSDVEVKHQLARVLNAFLETVRQRRRNYDAHPKIVDDLVFEGSERACQEATRTLEMMKRAMHMDYFSLAVDGEKMGER